MNWVPMIYTENKIKVLERLRDGELDYFDLSHWSFQDKFFAFLLATRFFEVCAESYPSPRRKEEVPVWFLLECVIQLKLHRSPAFSRLPGILRSGAILSRVGFNLGGQGGGFNHKNRKTRTSAIDQDCVRKFFRATEREAQRHWYNEEVVRFYRHHRAFDKHGIFLLDQTHIVVPDNANYTDAVRMPVDEHGQRIKTDNLSAEAKKAIKYRPCYALSELLHIGKQEDYFIVAGYQWGPGNTDELPQGQALVDDFVKSVGKGVMKLLIADRGYIDGGFITFIKKNLESDIILPLKSSMDMFQSAVRMAATDDYRKKWKKYREYKDEEKNITYREDVILIENPGIWEECEVELHVSLMRVTGSDHSERIWGLASTFEPQSAEEAFEYYALRTAIEQRHNEFKNAWYLNKFTTPNQALMETHVLFTLLTYSLIQLYLKKRKLTSLANKMINTLAAEEKLGTNSVLVYYRRYFGVFDLDFYTKEIVLLKDPAKERLLKWIDDFQKRGKVKGP